MKNKLVQILLILLLACALLLPGCSRQEQKNGSTTADTPDQTPQAVVTAGPNCTEIFIALGLEDYLVGCCCNNHSLGPLPEYAEKFNAVPELTYGYPTLEAVVGSGADFIYAIDWVFEGDFTVERLEEYGITVYVNDAVNYEELWQEIRDIAAAFGAEEAAAAFIADQQQRLAAVSELVAGQDPVSVVVYDSDQGGTVYTAGAANIETMLIESAGGFNIAANEVERAWSSISYEFVLEADPQVMIIHDYAEGLTIEEKIAEIKSDALLSQLSCVQDDRFVILSLECALPGVRCASSVEQIAAVLYPQLFASAE